MQLLASLDCSGLILIRNIAEYNEFSIETILYKINLSESIIQMKTDSKNNEEYEDYDEILNFYD